VRITWSSTRASPPQRHEVPTTLIIEQLAGEALARGHDAACRRSNLRLDRGFDRTRRLQGPDRQARMRQAPGARLRISNLHHGLDQQPASRGLERLVRLAANGKVIPHLGANADWRAITKVTLLDRRFPGKAVRQLSDDV
jgi:hypothetical protein